MQLRPIKDVRVGHIYELDKKKYGGGFIIVNEIVKNFYESFCFLVNWNNGSNVDLSNSTTEFLNFDISKNKDYKLIGSLNITHKIENNKLVEIPREELEVDDVVELLSDTQTELGEEYKAGIQGVIKRISKDKNYISLADYDFDCYEDYFDIKNDKNEINFKKIGIYGVTHTFINNKLGE